ncbi:hypothetical protein I6E74_03270 [Salinibacterium sp. SWN139]|uniref:hypothetical protein n=1 Tax=Salinibacterium sp. SWN139 TaxID=2792055 RepID=UPI0018CE25DD|nr:hypothetical protein [Salinibacterium sp. SWN139]MBH0053186.1 hypothetical protein [Salinibacterium sp. SWN139]
MGTSKRYAEQVDRRMSEQVVETIMQDEPSTLTDDELELDKLPLTRTPVAVPAVAWVRYGGVALRLPVEVVAWTERAVAIRWKTDTGGVHKAWVWASAVSTD